MPPAARRSGRGGVANPSHERAPAPGRGRRWVGVRALGDGASGAHTCSSGLGRGARGCAHGLVVGEERVVLGAERRRHALAVDATLAGALVPQRHAHAQPATVAPRPAQSSAREGYQQGRDEEGETAACETLQRRCGWRHAPATNAGRRDTRKLLLVHHARVIARHTTYQHLRLAEAMRALEVMPVDGQQHAAQRRAVERLDSQHLRRRRGGGVCQPAPQPAAHPPSQRGASTRPRQHGAPRAPSPPRPPRRLPSAAPLLPHPALRHTIRVISVHQLPSSLPPCAPPSRPCQIRKP